MSTAAVEMWYEDGPVSPACSWQLRHVELASPLARSGLPAGECMLWQPAHSATPPEWNAKTGENPITARAATATIKTTRIAFMSLPPKSERIE
jgi:hypothetical protein